MTWEEFKDAMTEMESQLIISDEQKQNRPVRWRSTFKRLQGFSIHEFSTAVQTLLDENKFLPARMEFVEACDEAREAQTTIKIPTRQTFTPEEHKCAKRKCEPSEALKLLAVISPYEAKHASCKGEIHATCPACGARHLDKLILEGISKQFPPEQTKGINFHLKGFLLCPDCEAKSNG